MWLNHCLPYVICAITTAAFASDISVAGPRSGENVKKVVISSLPDNIKLIIGQGDTYYYLPRIQAIHALPDNLPPDQIQACYDFLYTKLENQKLTDLEFNGLKNELVFAIINQRRKPVELAEHLVKIYKDKSFDVTWRDYCVQFFGKWYPKAPDNQARHDMIDGLWDALKNERKSKIAGAASSQLCFLARHYPEFDKQKVSEASYEALIDPECAEINKSILLNTCAVFGNRKILPIARELVVTESDLINRAAALFVLGELGDQSDLPTLTPLIKARDIRLRTPAAAAIKKITTRN